MTSTSTKVLSGRADERRPADVDLFDQRVEWQSGIAGCLHKGIEIDRNNVDEADAVTSEGRQIIRPVATRQNAAMHRRVQRLHAPVEHFGRTGYVRNARDRHGRGLEGSRRAAGGDDVVIPGRRAPGRTRRSRSCRRR